MKPQSEQIPFKDHPEQLVQKKRKQRRLVQLSRIIDSIELIDLLETYTNPKKRFIANFTAGLYRGLGLTIGTAVVLAILGWVTTQFVSIPVIGEFVGQIINYVKGNV